MRERKKNIIDNSPKVRARWNRRTRTRVNVPPVARHRSNIRCVRKVRKRFCVSFAGRSTATSVRHIAVATISMIRPDRFRPVRPGGGPSSVRVPSPDFPYTLCCCWKYVVYRRRRPRRRRRAVGATGSPRLTSCISVRPDLTRQRPLQCSTAMTVANACSRRPRAWYPSLGSSAAGRKTVSTPSGIATAGVRTVGATHGQHREQCGQRRQEAGGHVVAADLQSGRSERFVPTTDLSGVAIFWAVDAPPSALALVSSFNLCFERTRPSSL